MISAALKRFFVADPFREQAHHAYVHIVAQARQPVFFTDWQVEDTLDGRFDVIVLHLCLVIHRLESEPSTPEIKRFIRSLSEVFFADMDRSLRELGASDTGVGVRIKKMAQAFYGRLKAYSDALSAGSGLSDAISRNIYREKPPSPVIMEQWVAYSENNKRLLAGQPFEWLLQGNISFSR